MDGPLPLCNALLLLVTAVVSFLGFANRELEQKLIFNPGRILADKEYYRLVSSAFLHAEWGHLLVNLIGLYSFGGVVELYCGRGHFLLIYFGAIVGGSLLSLLIHRHHDYYAYGASGGVCGIIFAHLLLLPGSGVRLYFMLPIPGWLFAIGFLLASFFALQRGRDHIGHDAHVGGALVGLIIAAVLYPEAVRYNAKLFGLVLGVSLAALSYFWFNPLWLPLVGWFQHRGKPQSNLPRYKEEERTIDAILEKVGREGMDSLTAQEKALLQAASDKYRRRAESKKPESGLAI